MVSNVQQPAPAGFRPILPLAETYIGYVEVKYQNLTKEFDVLGAVRLLSDLKYFEPVSGTNHGFTYTPIEFKDATVKIDVHQYVLPTDLNHYLNEGN